MDAPKTSTEFENYSMFTPISCKRASRESESHWRAKQGIDIPTKTKKPRNSQSDEMETELLLINKLMPR